MLAIIVATIIAASPARDTLSNDTHVTVLEHNASTHARRGEMSIAQGDLDGALTEYMTAAELTGNTNASFAHTIGTLHQWRREYTDARRWFRAALALSPDDQEIREDLTALDYRRSLHFSGSVGGWEPDFTKNTYDLGAFIGWLDRMDILAQYSHTDRVFYRRSNFSADAYFFFSPRTYLRGGIRRKRYDYPTGANTQPDDNAYVNVTSVQAEVGHYYDGENYFSVEIEYFRPDFFWNSSLYAHNMKVSGTLRNELFGPLYGKLFVAYLRDPGPSTFLLDDVSRQIVSFGYRSHVLLGGALGVNVEGFSFEMKYIPDRDLDKSLDWSVFTRMTYSWEHVSVQHDFLYDRYPVSTFRGFSASRVNVFSIAVAPTDYLDLKGGIKLLSNTVGEAVPFVALRYRTGI